MVSKYKNCPLIGLREALDRAEKLQKIAFPATKLSIAEAMGYKGLHGTSYTAIDALLDYGLLEEIDGDKAKLSTVALGILSQDGPRPDSAQYAEVVQKAAFTPSLFKELWESSYNSQPDDADLTTSFKNLGLHPNKVGNAIRAYRETIEFVSKVGSFSRASLVPSLKSSGKKEQLWVWGISPDTLVQLRFEGPITGEALQELVEDLNRIKDRYPSGEKAPAGLTNPKKQSLSLPISADTYVQLHFEGPVTREAFQELVGDLNRIKDRYPPA